MVEVSKESYDCFCVGGMLLSEFCVCCLLMQQC